VDPSRKSTIHTVVISTTSHPHCAPWSKDFISSTPLALSSFHSSFLDSPPRMHLDGTRRQSTDDDLLGHDTCDPHSRQSPSSKSKGREGRTSKQDLVPVWRSSRDRADDPPIISKDPLDIVLLSVEPFHSPLVPRLLRRGHGRTLRRRSRLTSSRLRRETCGRLLLRRGRTR
jgi:hypothetical protein